MLIYMYLAMYVPFVKCQMSDLFYTLVLFILIEVCILSPNFPINKLVDPLGCVMHVLMTLYSRLLVATYQCKLLT